MFLEKCRWHFDFVLTKAEEFRFSQGPDGQTACREGRQKDQVDQANYWTRGEEPGRQRGSNNRYQGKGFQQRSGGSQ